MCQWFCTHIYSPNCTWFLYDKTTLDCKLFDGPQENFYSDCKEVGFAEPGTSFSECLAPFGSANDDICYVIILHQVNNHILYFSNEIIDNINLFTLSIFIIDSIFVRITADSNGTFLTISNMSTTSRIAKQLAKLIRYVTFTLMLRTETFANYTLLIYPLEYAISRMDLTRKHWKTVRTKTKLFGLAASVNNLLHNNLITIQSF